MWDFDLHISLIVSSESVDKQFELYPSSVVLVPSISLLDLLCLHCLIYKTGVV